MDVIEVLDEENDTQSEYSSRSYKTSQKYQGISFGFQETSLYEQCPKLTVISDIFYNEREGRFMLLDGRGIFAWNSKLPYSNVTERKVEYPKYKSKLIRVMIYSRKFNIYFAVFANFTLKVFNKDYQEIFTSNDNKPRSFLSLVFNPVTDELIATGVYGTIVWKFQQTSVNMFENIKHMANYELALKSEHPCPCDAWCSKVHLVIPTQQVFLCAETNLVVCDAKNMRTLFIIKGAHKSAVTCSTFSMSNKVIVTGSLDTEVKVWSAFGGHLCTFRGHSRSVTGVETHLQFVGLVFSSSLDGSIKVWSLDTMELFHNVSLSTSGIEWMGINNDTTIWCASSRKVITFDFSQVATYWGHTRCENAKLKLMEHPGKSKRIISLGKDGSIRLFTQTRQQTQTLCTVLPPPVITESSYLVSYSRCNNRVFLLIDPTNLWVYTTKTDPACRISEWSLSSLFKGSGTEEDEDENNENYESTRKMHAAILSHCKTTNRASAYLSPDATPHECCSLTVMFSPNGFQFESLDGVYSARSRSLLLLGMTDGRIIFLDEVEKLRVYGQLHVHKNPISQMHGTKDGSRLVVLIKDMESTIFQVYDLPTLKHLKTCCTMKSVNVFTLMCGNIICGNIDGTVSLLSLTETSQESVEFCKSLEAYHKSAIIDIQACQERNIFCTCGSDNDLKIWSMDKELLTDIRLKGTLRSCTFLNTCGDLIISWKNNLFRIDNSLVINQETLFSETNSAKESFIYEDPSVKKELRFDDFSSVTDINSYLCPYKLIVEKILDPEQLLKLEGTQKADDDDKSSYVTDSTLQADTEVYFSPQESLNGDDSIGDESDDEIDFPEFGISPGTTPESTIVPDEECFSSEEEFDESVFEVAESKIDFNKEIGKAAIVARAISKMKHEPKPAKEKPVDKIESRFSKFTIDTKSMMKKSMVAVLASEKLKKGTEAEKKKAKSQTRVITKKMRRPSGDSYRRSSVLTENSEMESESENFTKELQNKLIEIEEKSNISPLIISSITRSDHKRRSPRAGSSTKFSSPFASDSFARRKASVPKYEGFPTTTHRLKRRTSKSAQAGKKKSSTRRGSIKNTSNLLENLPEESMEMKGIMKQRTKSAPSFAPTQSFQPPINHMMSSFVDRTGDRDIARFINRDSSDPNLHGSVNSDMTAHGDSLQRPIGEEGQHSAHKVMGEVSRQDVQDKEIHLGPADTLVTKKTTETQLEQMFLDADIRRMFKDEDTKYEKGWQDRELEKYKLRKMQENHRRMAANQKRVFLEQERLFRLYTMHPEWMMSQIDEDWIDPDVLSKFILNSVMRHPAKITQKTSSSSQDPQPDKQRSVSAMGYNEYTNQQKKYRISVRERSPGGAMFPSRCSSAVSKATDASHSVTLPQTVRSSSSIPGKTRYILLHPEPTKSNVKLPEPNKLESGLLRNRFPSLYGVVNKTYHVSEEPTIIPNHKKMQQTAHWHDLLVRRETRDTDREMHLRKSEPIFKTQLKQQHLTRKTSLAI